MSTTALPTSSATAVDLSGVFDNRGTTQRSALDRGAFNIWSNTFPAEELPAPGGTIVLGGVPFHFPAPNRDGYDNFRCGGQLVNLPVGRYDWLYLLAAAERRSEDMVALHHTDGSVDVEWLRVSDFWAETPAHFGERFKLSCGSLHYPRHVQSNMSPAIWRTRVPVPAELDLAAVGFPDNPAIHVFALTLVAPAVAS
ncbi:MAG TPA: hypothetical protein VFW65_07710 [Pseudonocardiaceae bacterium]|nr:hypothetical protein [Pseudonocardiaceae bacterium]